MIILACLVYLKYSYVAMLKPDEFCSLSVYQAIRAIDILGAIALIAQSTWDHRCSRVFDYSTYLCPVQFE